jgi:tRNA(adenine34) deaminase
MASLWLRGSLDHNGLAAITTACMIVAVSDQERLMRLALDEARHALAAAEVPIGAIVVVDGEVVGRGFNRPISATDPTAHAEIVALRQAAAAVGNYRLSGADLYVTLEPCLMCVGALVHARVATLVFGALEPKTGAVVSTTRALEIPSLNHRVEVVSGVLEDDCRAIVQAFFKAKR